MAVLCANPHILYPEFNQRDQIATNASSSVPVFDVGLSASGRDGGKRDSCRYLNKTSKAEEFWPEAPRPSTEEMEPITDMDHMDQILVQAQESSQPILIDWMAYWCRKCIYLKPKLEKLAAEYGNIMKLYYVDVNSVPQALVKRGNISVWKDGEMKEEVIGGHKAWLVVDKVRDTIRKYI